jgi:hypothetical protein
MQDGLLGRLLLIGLFSCQEERPTIVTAPSTLELTDTIVIPTFSKNLLYAGYDDQNEQLVFLDNTLDSLAILQVGATDHKINQLLLHRRGDGGVGKRLSSASFKGTRLYRRSLSLRAALLV